MVKLDRMQWKQAYFKRIEGYLAEFSKCIVICIDNIQSRQMQDIRLALRNKAEILCGKNTLIRRAFINVQDQYPFMDDLLAAIKGNVAIVFTDMDLAECRDTLISFQVQAPAKAGTIAQCDVFIEEGPTGMSPEKTSFFQAVDIPTKIAKGQIAILNRYKLITEGDKVGLSEAKLLAMLGVSPFHYGVIPTVVLEEGSVYPSSVLDIKPEEFLTKVATGIQTIASVSLALGFVNKASVPHLIVNGFKNVIAVALATDITFGKPTPGLENAKLFLSDPEAFAAANAGGGGGGGGGGGDAPAASGGDAAPAKVEESESESEDMESLFD